MCPRGRKKSGAQKEFRGKRVHALTPGKKKKKKDPYSTIRDEKSWPNWHSRLWVSVTLTPREKGSICRRHAKYDEERDPLLTNHDRIDIKRAESLSICRAHWPGKARRGMVNRFSIDSDREGVRGRKWSQKRGGWGRGIRRSQLKRHMSFYCKMRSGRFPVHLACLKIL